MISTEVAYVGWIVAFQFVVAWGGLYLMALCIEHKRIEIEIHKSHPLTHRFVLFIASMMGASAVWFHSLSTFCAFSFKVENEEYSFSSPANYLTSSIILSFVVVLSFSYAALKISSWDEYYCSSNDKRVEVLRTLWINRSQKVSIGKLRAKGKRMVFLEALFRRTKCIFIGGSLMGFGFLVGRLIMIWKVHPELQTKLNWWGVAGLALCSVLLGQAGAWAIFRYQTWRKHEWIRGAGALGLALAAAALDHGTLRLLAVRPRPSGGGVPATGAALAELLAAAGTPAAGAAAAAPMRLRALAVVLAVWALGLALVATDLRREYFKVEVDLAKIVNFVDQAYTSGHAFQDFESALEILMDQALPIMSSHTKRLEVELDDSLGMGPPHLGQRSAPCLQRNRSKTDGSIHHNSVSMSMSSFTNADDFHRSSTRKLQCILGQGAFKKAGLHQGQKWRRKRNQKRHSQVQPMASGGSSRQVWDLMAKSVRSLHSSMRSPLNSRPSSTRHSERRSVGYFRGSAEASRSRSFVYHSPHVRSAPGTPGGGRRRGQRGAAAGGGRRRPLPLSAGGQGALRIQLSNDDDDDEGIVVTGRGGRPRRTTSPMEGGLVGGVVQTAHTWAGSEFASALSVGSRRVSKKCVFNSPKTCPAEDADTPLGFFPRAESLASSSVPEEEDGEKITEQESVNTTADQGYEAKQKPSWTIAEGGGRVADSSVLDGFEQKREEDDEEVCSVGSLPNNQEGKPMRNLLHHHHHQDKSQCSNDSRVQDQRAKAKSPPLAFLQSYSRESTSDTPTNILDDSDSPAAAAFFLNDGSSNDSVNVPSLVSQKLAYDENQHGVGGDHINHDNKPSQQTSTPGGNDSAGPAAAGGKQKKERAAIIENKPAEGNDGKICFLPPSFVMKGGGGEDISNHHIVTDITGSMIVQSAPVSPRRLSCRLSRQGSSFLTRETTAAAEVRLNRQKMSTDNHTT